MSLDVIAHLDDRETEHRGGNIAYPHTSKHRHEHARQQHVSWTGASFAEHKSRHHFGDVVF